MSREDPKVNIRLPADLKDQLHAMAADNKRSVNSEVVAAIEVAVGLHKLEKELAAKAIAKPSDAPQPTTEKQYLITEEKLKTMIAEVTQNIISKLK